ncbi:phosphoribosylformylglycinamidine synthase I [Candidatus Omnitrophota bacterium]
MSKKPKVLVLRTAGTNCDLETAHAFDYFGASVEFEHIKHLLKRKSHLKDCDILAIPGGFTYGDDIESGRLLANELRLFLKEELMNFIAKGKLIIGICNGFQVLVKTGILPGIDGSHVDESFKQQTSLVNNNSGKFEDRWTHLKVSGKSVWTKGLSDVVYFPVAHAEGKFVVKNDAVLKKLKAQGQIAFQYCAQDGGAPQYPENPNGSVADIAGITDSTGHVLGLMPHPERHFYFIHHPFWSRFEKKEELGEGAQIFKNGVDYIKKKFK